MCRDTTGRPVSASRPMLLRTRESISLTSFIPYFCFLDLVHKDGKVRVFLTSSRYSLRDCLLFQ